MDKEKSLYTMRVFDEYGKFFAIESLNEELKMPVTIDDRIWRAGCCHTP